MHKALWLGSSAVVVLVALIMSVIVIDALGRRLVLNDKTEYTFVESTKPNSSRLFVYFPGILADGVQSSLQLQPVWRQYGDVLLVSYNGERFIASRVVSTIAKAVQERSDAYGEVVFIGSSMGGLLSYDTALELMKGDPARRFKFILVDAPTRRADFQSPLDKVSLGAWVVGGPLTNLFSRQYFNLTFRPPAEENIEAGVNRKELAARVEEAKSFPLSTHNDWIRYIMSHGKMMAGSLQGHRAVYIRSARDTDTVRPEAFYAWKRVFGRTMRHMTVDSTHVGYNERPTTWQAGFREAFRRIGIS